MSSTHVVQELFRAGTESRAQNVPPVAAQSVLINSWDFLANTFVRRMDECLVKIHDQDQFFLRQEADLRALGRSITRLLNGL